MFRASQSPPEPATDVDSGMARSLLHGSRMELSGDVKGGDGAIGVRKGYQSGVTLDPDRVTKQAERNRRGGAEAARHETFAAWPASGRSCPTSNRANSASGAMRGVAAPYLTGQS